MKLSAQIRDGMLKREEALAQLQNKNDEPPEMDNWLKSLSLAREDLEIIKGASYDGFKSYNLKLLKILKKYTKLVSFPYGEELE